MENYYYHKTKPQVFFLMINNTKISSKLSFNQLLCNIIQIIMNIDDKEGIKNKFEVNSYRTYD
jgi:hypothetical protein